MNIMKLLVKCLYAAEIIILMTLAGCTTSKTLKNQTLVITPNWSNDQDIRGGTGNNGLRTLGLDNDYLSKKFAFHPEIAKSILSQHPGILSAYVLLTEVNCYLAIVPNRHNPKLIASQEILNHRTDQKGVTGFFEDPDMINRVDWVSQSGNLPDKAARSYRPRRGKIYACQYQKDLCKCESLILSLVYVFMPKKNKCAAI